ncbi:MAG: hypothetical protein GXO43_09815 [Crenarchaeota archaeon]|nr:hypothetical protein [Thermoproteota archaeon]
MSQDLPGLEELPELKALESLLKALVKRARRIGERQRLAWLHGFAFGDASIPKRSTLGLETSRLDTLLAFLAVAISFANYDRYGLRAARVYPYIRMVDDTKSLQRYKWHAFIYLEPDTYSAVSVKKPSIIDNYTNSIEILAAFTAGLIDSDGTIVISVKKRRRKLYFEPEVTIVNTDIEALESLRRAWMKYGVTLSIHGHSKRGKARGITRLKDVAMLRTCSQHEIRKLLTRIIPYMFHIKRLARAAITLSYIEGRIPRDPLLIKQAVDKLTNYYDHTLKTMSISIIEKLYWKNIVLAIAPNGSIELIKKRHIVFEIP